MLTSDLQSCRLPRQLFNVLGQNIYAFKKSEKKYSDSISFTLLIILLFDI